MCQTDETLEVKAKSLIFSETSHNPLNFIKKAIIPTNPGSDFAEYVSLRILIQLDV